MFDLKMISDINNLLINNQEMTVNEIVELNKITEKYGLALTKEQAIELYSQ